MLSIVKMHLLHSPVVVAALVGSIVEGLDGAMIVESEGAAVTGSSVVGDAVSVCCAASKTSAAVTAAVVAAKKAS
jgi:hypothetical protein